MLSTASLSPISAPCSLLPSHQVVVPHRGCPVDYSLQHKPHQETCNWFNAHEDRSTVPHDPRSQPQRLSTSPSLSSSASFSSRPSATSVPFSSIPSIAHTARSLARECALYNASTIGMYNGDLFYDCSDHTLYATVPVELILNTPFPDLDTLDFEMECWGWFDEDGEGEENGEGRKGSRGRLRKRKKFVNGPGQMRFNCETGRLEWNHGREGGEEDADGKAGKEEL